MPWNGSGVFTRIYSWVSDNASGVVILPDRVDTDTDDIATGLEHCLTVNGETVPIGNMNGNNYRWTNCAPGVNANDYVTVGQVNSGGGGVTGGGFVPIAGGNMTGALNVASGIATTGANAGFTFNGRDGSQNFLWYATANSARLWDGADRLVCDSSGNLTCTGAFYAAGQITTNGGVNANGTGVFAALQAGTNVSVGTTLYVGNMALYNDGGGHLYSNYAFRAPNLYSDGSLFVGGLQAYNNAGYFYFVESVMGAGDIHAQNNLVADGVIFTGGLRIYNSGGYVTTDAAISVPDITCRDSASIAGTLNVGGASGLENVTLAQLNTAWDIVAGHHVWPNYDANWYCGLASNAWLGVESYNYYTASDRARKRELAPAPPGCLGLVQAIAPQIFCWDLPARDGSDPELVLERERRHWGFVAQEVGAAMREAGHEFGGHAVGAGGEERLALMDMVAVLWGAVRELADQVAAQKGS